MKGIFLSLSFSLSLLVEARTFLPAKLEIKFVKELKSILKKKKKSSGILSYQYPGQIRIEQHQPFKTMFISNGKKAWLYSAPLDATKEQGEVVILGPQKVPLMKILDGLRKWPRSNKTYTVSRQGKTLALNFNTSPKQQIEYVKLEMADARTTDIRQLKTLTIKTKSATESYQVVEINRRPSFPPDHFNFKVTDKMQVTENI